MCMKNLSLDPEHSMIAQFFIIFLNDSLAQNRKTASNTNRQPPHS